MLVQVKTETLHILIGLGCAAFAAPDLTSPHLTSTLTVKVIGAPQMISQPVSSIFSVLHCSLGLGELQACPFPDVVFPLLSLSAFFPLSLCLVRWFWPDLMNGKHDHTTAMRLFTIVRSSCGPIAC